MTQPITKIMPKPDATPQELVRDLFFELHQNGWIDMKTGDIESRVEPDLLRKLLAFAR